MNENIKIYDAVIAIVVSGLIVFCVDSCSEKQIELEKFKLEHNVK